VPVLATRHLNPLVARQIEQHAGVVRIVLDDQQHRIARLQRFAIIHQIIGAHRRQHDRMQTGRDGHTGLPPRGGSAAVLLAGPT
jgi:hypothetical protein